MIPNMLPPILAQTAPALQSKHGCKSSSYRKFISASVRAAQPFRCSSSDCCMITNVGVESSLESILFIVRPCPLLVSLGGSREITKTEPRSSMVCDSCRGDNSMLLTVDPRWPGSSLLKWSSPTDGICTTGPIRGEGNWSNSISRLRWSRRGTNVLYICFRNAAVVPKMINTPMPGKFPGMNRTNVVTAFWTPRPVSRSSCRKFFFPSCWKSVAVAWNRLIYKTVRAHAYGAVSGWVGFNVREEKKGYAEPSHEPSVIYSLPAWGLGHFRYPAPRVRASGLGVRGDSIASIKSQELPPTV